MSNNKTQNDNITQLLREALSKLNEMNDGLNIILSEICKSSSPPTAIDNEGNLYNIDTRPGALNIVEKI